MTTLEQAAVKAWRSWGYAWMLFTSCSRCGEMKVCRGKSRERLVCLDCFDQE